MILCGDKVKVYVTKLFEENHKNCLNI